MEQRKKFDQAIACLSPRIKTLLSQLNDDVKSNTQEIRLRSNMPIILTGSYGCSFISGLGRVTYICTETSVKISSAELADTFNRICGFSMHSHQSSILNGYVTIEGGHRAGICGTGACENGKLVAVRDISSVNLRIAGEYYGAADDIISKIYSQGLKSVIIAGAPSTGKTTILRDMARQLSCGVCEKYYKTVIVDERKEIAAVKNGIPQNDIGINCDVLDLYPKGEGILSALRSLSPEIIICDEIGALDEMQAIESGVNSGVKFAISVHASSFNEIVRRPQIKRLISSNAFDYLVLLKSNCAPCTIAKIYEMDELADEINRNDTDFDFMHNDWAEFKPQIITTNKSS